MSRYEQLIHIINDIKPKIIVEIGTWNGDRAIQMVGAALKHAPEGVTYYGFDMFEDMTEAKDKEELNVKKHFTAEEVARKLQTFANKHKNVNFQLVRGDTREVLPEWLKQAQEAGVQIDFAFIDGGHSLETIRSDIRNLRGAKVCVVDDYYVQDEIGERPDIKRFGCNKVVEKETATVTTTDVGKVGKDGKHSQTTKTRTEAVLWPAWKFLGALDPVLTGGYVQMVVRGWAGTPQTGKQNLQIKTKNCVPDAQIQGNIHYTMGHVPRRLYQCAPNGLEAVFLSAGPTLKDQLPKIKDHAFKAIRKHWWDTSLTWEPKPDKRVICVKHSHDLLIEEGIVPWACILLDPRQHVKDFIENPHPKVKYIVASMCHPTTIDRLVQANADWYVYHALVGAGEQQLLGPGHLLVGGGSTAATRGISVLHVLGFRKFTCFGYDSCYWTEPDWEEKTQDGAKKHYKVTVQGRDFFSDGELIAQAQDFEKILQDGRFDIQVEGDGMIPHIHETMSGQQIDFRDMFR